MVMVMGTLNQNIGKEKKESIVSIEATFDV